MEKRELAVAFAVEVNPELTPVPVGPTWLVELAVIEKPELAVAFAVIGAECVWMTAVPGKCQLRDYVVKNEGLRTVLRA